MKTVETLNLLKPEHSMFMHDLAMVCKDDFLNDYDNDIILIINEYERQIKKGQTKAFLVRINGEKAGIIWVEMMYGVGRLRAGLLPKYRQGVRSYNLLKDFARYCFDSLKLRKLDAELVLPNDSKKTSAGERLLRHLGFKKEGLLKEALLRNGEPHNTILLGLTRNQYKGLIDVKIKKVVILKHAVNA
jgi:hypothetical protein